MRSVRREIILIKMDRRSNSSTSSSLSRLTRLMGATNTAIMNALVREERGVRPNACINANGITRVTRLIRDAKTANVIYSSRLDPTRRGGLRVCLSAGIVSEALIVLSVFTSETAADRNGVRIRLTRLGCELDHLSKLKGSVSELNNKVKAENPKRGGLRISHHLVGSEVTRLQERLGRIRGRESVAETGHRGGGMPIITVMKCAGTNGSALLGRLARTSILRRSGLFTALSPAAHVLTLSNGRRILLASAIKFVEGLPRRLVRTFGDALRRTGCTSVVFRIISTSGVRQRGRVFVACRALSSLNMGSGGFIALFGGRSTHASGRPLRSFETSCALGVSTTGSLKLSSMGSLLRRVLERGGMCVREVVPCSGTNIVRLVEGRNRLISRRCITSKVRVGTCIPVRICNELS